MSLAVSRESEVLNDNIFKISEHKRKRHRKVLGEESDILSPERRGFIFDNLMLSSSFMPSFFSATGSFTGIKLRRLLFNVFLSLDQFYSPLNFYYFVWLAAPLQFS